MRFFKNVLFVISLPILGLLPYGGLEFFETRQLIHTTLNHELSSAFYIRNFRNIDNAQTFDTFYKTSHHTLNKLKQAQNDFNQLTLYTPLARTIRNDYNQGVKAFETALNTHATQSPATLPALKKDINKAEQLLLNSRERLLNLSERYLLSTQIKMG